MNGNNRDVRPRTNLGGEAHTSFCNDAFGCAIVFLVIFILIGWYFSL